MQISETCIRRPVMTTLLTASLIVFGFFAYRLLSVAALPAVDFPTIQISANLPGASPETMAASVAGPIERQLSTIAGITSMTSTSALGVSTIITQFDLNRNIDGAALDVQTALTVAQRRLPVEMTTPPFFRKVNPGDYPVLYISLVSATLPLSTVDDYGEILLAQQISQLPGIAQVLVYGAQKYALRVQVDPVAAAARNISMEDVRTVVSKANSNTPVGSMAGDRQNIPLIASGAMRQASDYGRVVVAYRNGASIKLDEIARVSDSVENDQIASYFNNERAIVLAIQRQPDANTVSVVDSVKSRLPSYRAQIPAAIKMEVLNDRSISIRDSVSDVQETLIIAITLVILVIFMFLRSVSATIIPALAVPISVGSRRMPVSDALRAVFAVRFLRRRGALLHIVARHRRAGARGDQRSAGCAAVWTVVPGTDDDGGLEARRKAGEDDGPGRYQGQLGEARRARRDERRTLVGRNRLRHRRRPLADHAVVEDARYAAGSPRRWRAQLDAGQPGHVESERQVDPRFHRQGQDRGDDGQGLDSGAAAADGGGQGIRRAELRQAGPAYGIAAASGRDDLEACGVLLVSAWIPAAAAHEGRQAIRGRTWTDC